MCIQHKYVIIKGYDPSFPASISGRYRNVVTIITKWKGEVYFTVE